MREEAAGISGGDGFEGGAGGSAPTPVMVRSALPRNACLILAKASAIGVKSGVGRQEQHAAAYALDQRPCAGTLVHWQVVQDHDLPRHEGGQQELLDVGVEALPRQGAIKDHRRPRCPAS